MSDREKFEAHMRERGEDYLYRRDVKGSALFGQYCSQTVQDHWEIWQASRRAALEEAAKHVETLGLVFFFGEQEFAKTGRACTANAIRALAEGGERE